MSDSFPDIKSIVIRIVTDKPVRKTPYQVKGVFMRQFPDESIVPMLNGSLRDKFLYPRVQVKILNEQIFIIGINEGVDPVLKLAEKFKAFDFGNITFEIESYDVEESENQFIPSEKLLKYEFVTPWIALNHMTGGKYRFLGKEEKPSFLNKLIGQNIVFLANELGVKLSNNIFTRVSASNLPPKSVDDNKWGAFMGAFETNFILPNYIGVGNGITRGFGTIFGVFNQDKLSFNETKPKEGLSEKPLIIEEQNDLETISTLNIPKPKRKKRKHRKPRQKRKNKIEGKAGSLKANNKLNKNKGRGYKKTKKILSEEFDIEATNINLKSDVIDEADDQNFNTEKHHKKQHKF